MIALSDSIVSPGACRCASCADNLIFLGADLEPFTAAEELPMEFATKFIDSFVSSHLPAATLFGDVVKPKAVDSASRVQRKFFLLSVCYLQLTSSPSQSRLS